MWVGGWVCAAFMCNTLAYTHICTCVLLSHNNPPYNQHITPLTNNTSPPSQTIHHPPHKHHTKTPLPTPHRASSQVIGKLIGGDVGAPQLLLGGPGTDAPRNAEGTPGTQKPATTEGPAGGAGPLAVGGVLLDGFELPVVGGLFFMEWCWWCVV